MIEWKQAGYQAYRSSPNKEKTCFKGGIAGLNLAWDAGRKPAVH